MAEIKIHLRYNLETGKKDIVIEYESEDDAMAYEHEQRHWEIVEELIGKGVINPEDVGNVRVGKVNEQETPTTAPAAPKPQAQGSGE